jgi:hypothetical protein
MTDLEALLGADEPAKVATIPVEKLIVRWDRLPGTDTVTNVRVMHSDHRPPGSNVDCPDSGGCCQLGWLTDALGTPLGLFVGLLADGFASREDMQAALHQFRNVEGQKGWTSDLLARLCSPEIATTFS